MKQTIVRTVHYRIYSSKHRNAL